MNDVERRLAEISVAEMDARIAKTLQIQAAHQANIEKGEKAQIAEKYFGGVPFDTVIALVREQYPEKFI